MKSWLSLLENIPDCELKTNYIDGLLDVVRHLEPSIQGVFDKWAAMYGISVGNVEDMEIDYDV